MPYRSKDLVKGYLLRFLMLPRHLSVDGMHFTAVPRSTGHRKVSRHRKRSNHFILVALRSMPVSRSAALLWDTVNNACLSSPGILFALIFR
jgi:hypothetical protein